MILCPVFALFMNEHMQVSSYQSVEIAFSFSGSIHICVGYYSDKNSWVLLVIKS